MDEERGRERSLEGERTGGVDQDKDQNMEVDAGREMADERGDVAGEVKQERMSVERDDVNVNKGESAYSHYSKPPLIFSPFRFISSSP